MATTSEIAEVRANTDEPRDSEEWPNDKIGSLIDAHGIDAASAIIWRRKAAEYAKLVNTSEAGASHSFGDLQAKALQMAAVFEQDASAAGRVKVKTIERS